MNSANVYRNSKAPKSAAAIAVHKTVVANYFNALNGFCIIVYKPLQCIIQVLHYALQTFTIHITGSENQLYMFATHLTGAENQTANVYNTFYGFRKPTVNVCNAFPGFGNVKTNVCKALPSFGN